MKSPIIKSASGVIEIYPNTSCDTINGKRTNTGVMFMQVHAASGSLIHKGNKIEFNVGSGMDGSTTLLANGRYAKINIEEMVRAAIDSGWLEKTLDFK